MKNTKRALRRHHRARLLQRALNTYKDWGWPTDPDHLLWKARRCFNNMQNCSCQMCCNQRRSNWVKGYDRLTFGEKRNLDSFNDQIKEVDDLGYLEYNPYEWEDEDNSYRPVGKITKKS